jgi:hypothetical protein
MVSPSGIWRKSSKPSTSVNAGNLRNQGLAGGLYQIAIATWVKLNLQCSKGFFPLNSQLPPFLNPLPFRSDTLRRGSKNGQWEGNFPFNVQGCSGQATPQWNQKAKDATSWTALRLQRWLRIRIPLLCPQHTDDHISALSAQLPCGGHPHFHCTSTASGRIDLDSSDG